MPQKDTELDCLRYTIASQESRFIEWRYKVKLPILPKQFFNDLKQRRRHNPQQSLPTVAAFRSKIKFSL